MNYQERITRDDAAPFNSINQAEAPASGGAAVWQGPNVEQQQDGVRDRQRESYRFELASMSKFNILDRARSRGIDASLYGTLRGLIEAIAAHDYPSLDSKPVD